MSKKPFSLFPNRMKYKFAWGDKVRASGIYECSICGNYQAFQKGEFFSQCDECIKNHEQKENQWFVTNEFLYFMSKNMNMEFARIQTMQQKLADWITRWAGNMGFVYLHIVWFAGWILLNLGYFGTQYVFDPYPFGLLTMIVSLEAIFLATFIMISQNLTSQKQEMRSEHEYQINLQAEKNVAEILAIIKELKKENELKNQNLEEIKDTIAEIAPEAIQETAEATPKVEDVPLEAIEKEHFEEQEQILDEAGIDIMPESAPPVVLEEVKKKRGRKKKAETQ